MQYFRCRHPEHCCSGWFVGLWRGTPQNAIMCVKVVHGEEGNAQNIESWLRLSLLHLGFVQNQVLVLTSPYTGNPSFAVFVLTYFFFSWLETDLSTYLLMQKSAFLGHRSYLLTCRRSVAGGARALTYCSRSWYSRTPNWWLLLTSLSST